MRSRPRTDQVAGQISRLGGYDGSRDNGMFLVAGNSSRLTHPHLYGHHKPCIQHGDANAAAAAGPVNTLGGAAGHCPSRFQALICEALRLRLRRRRPLALLLGDTNPERDLEPGSEGM